MEKTYTIAVDFDGVVCDKRDQTPIAGSLEGIEQLRMKYLVVIFTARHDLELVSIWLEDHGYPKMQVVNRKPSALVYLDDHAVRFSGSWDQSLLEIKHHSMGWQDAPKS